MEPQFRQTRRVAFSETDAAGIVHFSRYFPWMEECEHAFLRALGVPVHTADAEGERLFPRVQATASYTRPLRFDDVFDVCVRLRERRAKVLVWDFTFVPEGEDTPCATGSTTVVFARRTPDGIRSAPLPADLVAALDAACACAPAGDDAP